MIRYRWKIRLKGGEYLYSLTCHNPYPSVDGPGYGLSQVMGFKRSAKIGSKIHEKFSKIQ